MSPTGRKPSPPPVEDVGQFRCSSCGYFLGYGEIKEAAIYLYCKNCKGWTVFSGGKISTFASSQRLGEILERFAPKRKMQPTLLTDKHVG